MAERSWFFASNGQQQGPYGEAQFRDFAARGSITPDTLVWTEGMADWRRAGDIPGLMAGDSRPPAMAQSGSPLMAEGSYGGGALSVDFGIWEFTWRGLAFMLGLLVVLPAPWVMVWFLNWLLPQVHVPGRPNMSFTGKPMTVATWYFGFIVLAIAISLTGVQWLGNLVTLAQFVLYWLFLKWLIANLASNGQPLGLSFAGSFLGYLGWSILTLIAFITIIGWAWVLAAQFRWICRNIEGTRRQVVYNGTGLENLWRTLVFAIGAVFVIPVPWLYRWLMRWQLSQTELVERV